MTAPRCAGITAILLFVTVSGFAQNDLTLAAVQLRITAEPLASARDYRDMIENAVDTALGEGPVDLVVFPEYTGVFASLIPYGKQLAGSRSFVTFKEQVLAEAAVSSAREFFLTRAADTRSLLDRVFGELAARHGIWVVAGSYFAATAGGQLRNRALVYGPGGRVAYTQDKVFLTDFERLILGVDAGDIRRAGGFQVGGWGVGLTICRDTFFSQWEPLQAGHDLWIDIKANGVVFDQEEEERFLKALPARVAASGVPHGVTVCLTGRILDLVWEGESSHVVDEDGVAVIRERSDTVRGQETLRVTLNGAETD